MIHNFLHNARSLLLGVILLLVSACTHNKKDDTQQPQNPYELYLAANQALSEKDYKKSAELYGKITYEFPYYSGASRAHIMEIYSYFLSEDYDNVIFSADNYIKTYPVSPHIAYAYYLKALASYEQIGIPYRDTDMANEARLGFAEVISRFPSSIYAKDSTIKINVINNHLAAHEMIIARYYLKKGDIISAINRLKDVELTYPKSQQAEEALFRLAEAYNFLGMQAETKKHLDLLAQRYPKSAWLARTLK
jgi:outer membrane protein assembly factor BamD